MAFILTPLIAAFLFACLLPGCGWPSWWDRVFCTTKFNAELGTYPPALVFGVPALLIFRKRVRATLLNCGIVGSVVAAAPWFILSVYIAYGDYRNGLQSTATIFRQWLYFLPFQSVVGLAGMFAGFIFWVIAVAGVEQKMPGPA